MFSGRPPILCKFLQPRLYVCVYIHAYCIYVYTQIQDWLLIFKMVESVVLNVVQPLLGMEINTKRT